MSDKYFVDINILVYAHDRTAGAKHERARQLVEHLWLTREGVLSTRILQELCVTLRRKVTPSLSWEQVISSKTTLPGRLSRTTRHP